MTLVSFGIGTALAVDNELQAAGTLVERPIRVADSRQRKMALVEPGAMSLWALASDALPKLLGWIGAVISTIVTGLTIYMHTSAVNHKRKKAQLVTDDLGKFVAEVRTNPQLSDVEYWRSYKFFEAKIRELRYARGDD